MPTYPSKEFKLLAEQIQQLAPGRGAAICTDRITVDGCPVGYLYRAEPDWEQDSGWVFTAGDESEAYMDDASNLAFYNVNTVANYDPEIIPLLDAPVGSAFYRTENGFEPDPEGAPTEG